MSPDHLPSFTSIDTYRTPWSRWLTSIIIHAVAIAIIVAIPVAVHDAVRRNVSETRLVAPRLTPPPPPPPPVRIKLPKFVPTPPERKVVLSAPLPIVMKVKPEPPKIEPPKVVEPPKIEAIKTPQPKIDLPAPTPAPAPRTVKTDVFAANAPTPMGPKPVTRDVKLGGFGDPEGVQASATSTGKGLTLAKVGSFDLPVGAGKGGMGGKGTVVASAGFGSGGTGTGGSGTGGHAAPGSVHTGGFGEYQPTQAAARPVKVAVPVQTPVEILFKPKPVYTAEARDRKIEGEVQLDVVFRANGQISILRVVRGLGMGLDESARDAASHIRFRPGTKDGNPVDVSGIVHIVFELS